MAKLRVLFLNDTSRNGGPGRSLYYILKFLDPERIHRSVLLPRPGVLSELYQREKVTEELFFDDTLVENPVEPWSRAMERSDFEANPLTKGRRLVGNVGRGAYSVLNLSRRLKAGKYDLLYCNGTNADFFGGASSKLSGVPAIWHVRYTSVPKALASVHDHLAASPGVARIVCVSKASAALFPHCPEKVRVVHNALDPEDFGDLAPEPVLRRELGFPEGTVVFGSQGRILPRKGYMELVDAAKIALARMSESERARVRFVVLGDTPEDIFPDHLAECRKKVTALGLDAFVHFVGFRVDVRPYVADFDVAVVPSVYPDPLPRAVIESMAMGKPVVAFDVGGVAEMLRAGETGTLVGGAPPDVNGLAEAFLRYFRNPELRKTHGTAGRARIETHFSAEHQAKIIQEEIERAARR
jgi:glycosyltransferase involved in cell wall biosynthesis